MLSPFQLAQVRDADFVSAVDPKTGNWEQLYGQESMAGHRPHGRIQVADVDCDLSNVEELATLVDHVERIKGRLPLLVQAKFRPTAR